MATPTSSTPDIKPVFQRVQQTNDFDDIFACLAMLTAKPLPEVRQVAIDRLKHPKHGPYMITDTFITQLFAYYGLIATPYKPLNVPIAELPPDVALLWIATDPENEIGRHVLFHRIQATGGGKTATPCVIDPAYWVEPAQQISTDCKALMASWYIGVHPAKAVANGK